MFGKQSVTLLFDWWLDGATETDLHDIINECQKRLYKNTYRVESLADLNNYLRYTEQTQGQVYKFIKKYALMYKTPDDLLDAIIAGDITGAGKGTEKELRDLIFILRAENIIRPMPLPVIQPVEPVSTQAALPSPQQVRDEPPLIEAEEIPPQE